MIRLLLVLSLWMITHHVAEAKNFVVIASTDSRFNELSKDELVSLYLGRIKSIGSEQAKAIDFTDDSSIAQKFRTAVLRKNPVQYRQYWARLVFTGKAQPPSASIQDANEMVEFVKTNPDAIGYIPKGAKAEGVKVLLEI